MKFFGKYFAYSFAILAIFFAAGLVNNHVVFAALVNINTASATELDSLPEVGPATATKIINYRLANGPFATIEDLRKVSGFGGSGITFDKVKAFITVGDVSGGEVAPPAPPSGNPDADNGVDGDEGDNANNDSEDIGDSAHYEQGELSNYEETAGAFKVSAGRKRVNYVGSPIVFEVKVKLSADSKKNSADYVWSFGDGASAQGERVIHFFKYPGEYNVVLNAEFGGENSVSRTVVKVLEPDLSVLEILDGSVEIKNNAKQELNLYNWSLVSGTQKYIFPLDTIISAGQKNTFPFDYTKFTVTENPWLMDATGKGVIPISVNLTRISLQNNNQQISVAEFERFVSELNKSQSQVETKPVVAVSNVVLGTSTTNSEEYWSDRYEKDTREALTVKSVVEAEVEVDQDQASPGFWSKVFHPVRTIKDAFYQ